MSSQPDPRVASNPPQLAAPSWRTRALTVACLAVLTVHFTITAVYLNSVSVVGLHWRNEALAYLEPLFRQRWTLFAPDPPLLDRRLDYQCDRDGVETEWLSRGDELLESHAGRRFGPAGRLRRIEQAAVLATLGGQDVLLDQLIASLDEAPPEQRDAINDLIAHKVAENIASSRTAYHLIWHYCRQDGVGEVDRIRYRIVTRKITPYSYRNDPDHVEEPTAVSVPWLRPAEIEDLDVRAREYLDLYFEQKAAGLTEPAGPIASPTPTEVDFHE
ncbi:DUF5819 family protein [Nannocystaceae bacterium ST9]